MEFEKWLPVVGYEGRYEVSNYGNVKSIPRTRIIRGHTYRIQGKMLSRIIDPTTKYFVVGLGDGEKVKKHSIHVLVLEAFVSIRPANKIALHYDGNRQNPNLNNLRWGTYKENSEDSARHGTQCRGENSPVSVLTSELVTWIRESKQSSLSLAPLIGVASSTIRAVRIGQNWAHQ